MDINEYEIKSNPNPINGYISLGSKINVNGNINQHALDSLLQEMFKESWVEITVEGLDHVQPGSQIRYIRYDRRNNDSLKFIAGGIIIDIFEEYLLFRGGARVWSLQKEDIHKLWTRSKESKNNKGESVVTFSPDAEGKHIVEINGTVVYRTNKSFNRERFIRSKKYLKAVETGVFKLI